MRTAPMSRSEKVLSTGGPGQQVQGSTANDVIRARIPADEKKAFEAVLEKMGIDTSSFIRMAVHQTILQQAIPFPVVAQKQSRHPSHQQLMAALEQINQRFDQTMRDLAK